MKNGRPLDKIKTLRELIRITKRLKEDGKKIVHCHGVFDLIHPGHIRYFSAAKQEGDILIVSLTADKFVKKGPGRPIFQEFLRAEVLSAIELIDYITIVHADTPSDVIRKLKPDVFVKGPENKQKRVFTLSPSPQASIEEAVKDIGAKLVTTSDIVFSSTHLINQYLEVYPPKTKDFIEAFKQKYSETYIFDRLESLRKLKVLVIGDAIVDQYVYSWPMGKSTKEPIAVHKYLHEESFAGGTLATANHIAALSDHVTLVTILGNKRSFESFIRRHMKSLIKLKFFYQRNGRTIVKRRYIDEFTKQKLFQISYIQDDKKLGLIEKPIVTYLKNELPKYDLVVVNDFGHGLLTKKIIRVIFSKAKYVALNVQANSANYGFNIITKYPRADYVCIDEQEIRLATHNRYSDLPPLMKRIYSKLKCRDMIVTRGPFGAQYYSRDSGLLEVPALTQKVVDRVGAGDALYAITAPCVYSGMEAELAAFIGNVAGALQIAVVGNKTPINFDEMSRFISRLLK